MTLVDIKGIVPWPLPPLGAAGSISSNALTMDATGEKVACICQVPKTGTISKVLFRTRTVATGGDCKVRLETVDLTTGDPSGTLVAVGAELDPFTIADTDDNKLLSATLGTAWTGATVGDLIAVVVTGPTSGTPDIDLAGWGDTPGLDFPYTDVFSASAWAKNTFPLIMGLEYSDGSFAEIPGTFAAEDLVSYTFDDSANPDEIGNRFKFPFDCTVDGVWVWVDGDADFAAKLYDDADTLLESINSDKDVRQGSAGEINYLRFNSQVSISRDTWYRVVFRATTTGANITVYGVEVGGVAARMDTLPAGQNVYATQRQNDGAWSNSTTNRYFIGLLVSQIDDGTGSGGGGGSINRGILTGGRL